MSDKKYKKGYYTSDEHLIDGAIEALENKPDDEKLFYMNCTIESHVPIIEKKYKEYDFEIEETSLNEAQTSVIKSYAQSCYNADKELGRLYDFIKDYKEPTILVFFGDHDLLNELKYFNTGDELLDSYRKYNTRSFNFSKF